jgi:hypothetical protein
MDSPAGQARQYLVIGSYERLTSIRPRATHFIFPPQERIFAFARGGFGFFDVAVCDW